MVNFIFQNMPQLHKFKTELFNIYMQYNVVVICHSLQCNYKSLKTEHTVRLCNKSNYLLN